MKVLLINPPSQAANPILPLGLAYLAAALVERKIAVEVIDAWVEEMTPDQLGQAIARSNPDLVGVSIMSPTYAAGMRVVDLVKSSCSAMVCVGGPHPSALPEQCLEDNPNIDFVIVGEAEQTLPDLVDALSKGGDTSAVKGIVFREGECIVATGQPDIIEDLDRLPFPARNLFPLEKYKTHPPYGKKNPYMTLITSRGCPFGCTYCSKSVFGNRYRTMSPSRVIDDIRHIISAYGVREIHFYDDDFTIDMERAGEICDLLISEKINISWSCTTRVDLINENLLRKMKRAGCWLVSYGVETSDPEILKKIRKGYTIEQVRQAFELTKKIGIRTVAFFMVGLPGESEESLQRTINFSLALAPDFVSWGVTALYPGSVLYDAALKGELGDINIRYTFEDRNWHASGSPYGDGYAIIYEENISRERLAECVQRANKAFYLRPAYLVRFVFKIRSLYEFFHYLKGGVKVLSWIFSKKHPVSS